MARTAGWSTCPMTSKKLSFRPPLLAAWKRRHQKTAPLFTWYNSPIIPKGYRGKLD